MNILFTITEIVILAPLKPYIHGFTGDTPPHTQKGCPPFGSAPPRKLKLSSPSPFGILSLKIFIFAGPS